MSKLSVIWLLIGVSKQKLLFWTMIFYFRSAECFFHGLHDSSCNTIVIDSWINFRLSISSCFVTEYIVVFNVMWSYSSKPSSNMFYWKGVIEVDWFERWHHLCRVRPYRSMVLSDLRLIINYEWPLQGKIKIIWPCILKRDRQCADYAHARASSIELSYSWRYKISFLTIPPTEICCLHSQVLF